MKNDATSGGDPPRATLQAARLASRARISTGETQDNENVRDVRLSARRAQGCRRRPRRVASQIAPSRRHRPQLRRRGRDQDLRRQDRRPPEGDRRGRRRGRPRHGVPPRARRLRRHHPGEERGHRRPRQVRVLRPGRRRLRMALRHRPVAHAPPRQVPRAVHRGGQEARGLHGHRARRPRLPRALRRSHLPRPPLRHRKDAQATRRGGIRRGGAIHRLARPRARLPRLRRRRVHRARRQLHPGLRRPLTRRPARARGEPARSPPAPVSADEKVLQIPEASRALLVPGTVRRPLPVQRPRGLLAPRGDGAHGRGVVSQGGLRQGARFAAGAVRRRGRGDPHRRRRRADRHRTLGREPECDRGEQGDAGCEGGEAGEWRDDRGGRGGGQPGFTVRVGPDDR